MRPDVVLALRAGLLAVLAAVALSESSGSPDLVLRFYAFFPGLTIFLPIALYLEARKGAPPPRWGFAWILVFAAFVIGLTVSEAASGLQACLILGAVLATSRTRAGGVLIGILAAGAGIYLAYEGGNLPAAEQGVFVLLAPLYLVAGTLSGNLARAFDRAREEVESLREELADQAEQINNVLACVASGVLVVDQEGKVRTFNHAAQRILGVPEHTVLGRAFESVDTMAQLVPAVASPPGGEADEGPRRDLEFLRPDGQTIFVGYAVSLLEDRAGRRLGRILVFQDVTLIRDYADRMLRQEQLASLGRMVSGIAHEFGNLLGGAQGLLELASQEEPKEAVESLPVVRETLSRALETVDNLLKFARGTPIHRVPGVDLGQVLDRSLHLLTAEIERHGVEVEHHREALPPVEADAVQLEQVFINLTLNALHAVSESEERRLRITASSPSPDRVRIVFEDTGPGVPDDVRDRVFEPFFTTKGALGGAKTPGTGLGLSMALGVVEGHDGTLSIGASPDLKGACFTVDLPSTNGEATSTT